MHVVRKPPPLQPAPQLHVYPALLVEQRDCSPPHVMPRQWLTSEQRVSMPHHRGMPEYAAGRHSVVGRWNPSGQIGCLVRQTGGTGPWSVELPVRSLGRCAEWEGVKGW